MNSKWLRRAGSTATGGTSGTFGVGLEVIDGRFFWWDEKIVHFGKIKAGGSFSWISLLVRRFGKGKKSIPKGWFLLVICHGKKVKQSPETNRTFW